MLEIAVKEELSSIQQGPARGWLVILIFETVGPLGFLSESYLDQSETAVRRPPG
jgi:hypothetical protein